MSAIELHIKHEDDGGEAWLTIDGAAIRPSDRGHSCFTVLDSGALDLLEALLRVRRPGTYVLDQADVTE